MDRIAEITEVRNTLSDLHTRMDLDRDIVTLLPYVLKGFSQHLKDKPIPNAVSVTLNKAAVFGDAFISTLSTHTRQPHVEGLSDTQNHDIEQFADDLMYTMDESIVSQRRGNSKLWFSQHISLRGAIGMGAFLLKQADGAYTFKFIPVDMRWCTWLDSGDGDYDWISNRTIRDSDSLRRELEKKGLDNTTVPDGKNLEVEDWWNSESNEMWVAGKKVFEQENTYGEIPYRLIFPNVGVFIEDAGYLQYRWESIFGLNRNLYPELNRLMSILQTIGAAILYPGLAMNTTDGKLPQGFQYPFPGTVLPMMPGETIQKILTPEVTQAFLTGLQTLSGAIDIGGISDAELGSADLDRPGVWFTQMNSIREKRMSPRKDAISQMYAELVKLAIRELKSVGKKAVLGSRRKEYGSLPDLEKITIEYRLMIADEVMDVVRAAQSKGMEGTLSLEDRLRDVIRHKDPDGVINRLLLERAIAENPIVRYKEMSRRFRVLAKEKFGQEKKDLISIALLCADLMEYEIDLVGQMRAQATSGRITNVSVEQPKGQGQALQGLTGMMNRGQKQLAAPKETVNVQ